MNYLFPLLLLIVMIFPMQAWAMQGTDIESITREVVLESPEINFLWEEILIDASVFDDIILGEYPSAELDYSWTIFSQDSQNWKVLQTSFDTFWEKAIELNIYLNNSEQSEDPELVYSSDFSVFIYQKSVALLTSKSIPREEINKFRDAAQDAWIYVFNVQNTQESYLYGDEIISSLEKYSSEFQEASDYITIWWEKEFLFSALSQIQSQSSPNSKLNIVLISPYNATILKNYIANSVSGKNILESGFIIDETLRYQLLKNPKSIDDLQLQLESNSYLYTKLVDSVEIPAYFFVSRFINELSNNGVRLTDIYIILLLPIFLTIVWVSKHFIWISTLWTIIPVFLWILYIKIGILFTLWVMLFLLVVNILLSKIISRYTLLYTPKVTFITIVNLIIFMWAFLLAKEFMSFNIPTDNMLYIIIFFIIAEKLVSIITSKEYREYKKSFWGTLIVSLLCFSLLHFQSFLVLLTAYPEILILLIPFNFMLGRFTWLRITEYLRFREIVKSIEE